MTGKEAGHIDTLQHPPHANALNAEELEVAPGTAHEQLEGWIPALASEEEIRAALEKAFDYRGDVTITRKDGSKIEGYLFDRRTAATLKESLVRLYPEESERKSFHLVRRHRRAGFYGTRHRRRKKLGSLDEKIRRKKSRRRKKPQPAPRTAIDSELSASPQRCHPERGMSVRRTVMRSRRIPTSTT